MGPIIKIVMYSVMVLLMYGIIVKVSLVPILLLTPGTSSRPLGAPIRHNENNIN